MMEELFESLYRSLAFLDDRGIVVKPPVQELFQRLVQRGCGRAEPGQAFFHPPDILHVARAARRATLACFRLGRSPAGPECA